jgi:hypothetical protein
MIKIDLSKNYRQGNYVKEALLATRTYYVRPDGNNGNSGLVDTPQGAWKTINYAANFVAKNIDCATNPIVIQVKPGTYNENVLLPPVVGAANNGACVVRGDITDPTQCVVNGQTPGVGAFYSLGNGNDWLIEGFKINSASYGIHGHANSWIRVGKVEFGNCTVHIQADHMGVVEIQSNYKISNGASRHIAAETRGYVLLTDGITVTLVGAPAFTAFSYVTGQALLRGVSLTFVGSATGQRFFVATGGGIEGTGGNANYFPGNAAGDTIAPGWYM